ncbi:MAG: hypothetical protein ACREST_08685 [Steroidobacteraceae bacterium]
MSRRIVMHAAIAAAGLWGIAATAGAQEALSIDAAALDAEDCFGQHACQLDGATLTTTGGALARKVASGTSGFGVSGGAAGPEIDPNQSIHVQFDQPRSIVAIKILYLYNGPEFADRAEKARITADGTTYTLVVRNDFDDAGANWNGAGEVTKCGATTAAGTGCFIVTGPFAGDVQTLDFTVGPGHPPFAGPGTNKSDYAIGFVDAAASGVIDLADCAGAEGCPVATVGGEVGFSFSSMEVTNPGGSTEALVIPVQLPDCRYIPKACLDLLPPENDSVGNDDAMRATLIGLGVIKPLDPSGPYKLNPAAQLLNVTPLLPPAVTDQFDDSGQPPTGLPPLYIAARWRGQAINDFRFVGFFFNTEAELQFSETFEGLIDVSLLTGQELGCFAALNPNNLLAYDVITTASERARSVGGRHVDKIINVGCENPTKVSGDRLSLYSINLEIVPDTFGPTIKSFSPKVTVNNDAVFARLVQAMWRDLGEIRANYACKQADPLPTGGQAPLAPALCKTLASLWSKTDRKIRACVDMAFKPITGFALGICEQAREYVDDFESALPATTTRPDPYNRLGELHSRSEAVKHVWDERFLRSLEPAGFCREKGTCPP